MDDNDIVTSAPYCLSIATGDFALGTPEDQGTHAKKREKEAQREGKERERERERERQTDRQTDRQTERQRDKGREGEWDISTKANLFLLLTKIIISTRTPSPPPLPHAHTHTHSLPIRF